MTVGAHIIISPDIFISSAQRVRGDQSYKGSAKVINP